MTGGAERLYTDTEAQSSGETRREVPQKRFFTPRGPDCAGTAVSPVRRSEQTLDFLFWRREEENKPPEHVGAEDQPSAHSVLSTLSTQHQHCEMNPGCAARAEMLPEIKAAVSFLVRLLRSSGFLPDTQLQVFRDCLQQALSDRYRHHWFPDRPQKGSGYRCIRINHEMDPLIGGAASRVGLSAERLFSLLPRELTLWIDPYEVSYRIGEDGSICVLYEAEAPASGPTASSPSPFDPLRCKNGFLMGRTSPPKHYLMTVSG